MGKRIRLALATLAGSLVFAIVSGVPGEFFIEWAREEGWYTAPSRKLDAVMTAVNAFVIQLWFIALTTLCVGLAIGVWLDTFLRHMERRSEARTRFQSNRNRQQFLIKELRKFDDGSYNVQILVSNKANLPFAKEIASCFRQAGWHTCIDTRPQEQITGKYWKGIEMQGFNWELMKLISEALAIASVHVWCTPKENRVARHTSLWPRIEHRLRLKIGHGGSWG
jgi:hypothetical protein